METSELHKVENTLLKTVEKSIDSIAQQRVIKHAITLYFNSLYTSAGFIEQEQDLRKIFEIYE